MNEGSGGTGPRVVALGGGHGLAASLRAARRYARQVTAVVSTADDGGSSGVLRRSLGAVPPGDLRKCLVALSDPSSLWARAFEYRFADGHALGNLIIAGLAEVGGDLQVALDEAASLLAAGGRVLAATTEPVVLRASSEERLVEGQAAVSRIGGITRISLSPVGAVVPEAVTAALEESDQIVLGPGSLFTSVLAVAVLAPIAAALKRAAGRLVYVCNLRPQIPETEGYDVAAHVRALHGHGIEPEAVLCDTSRMSRGSPTGIQVIEAELTSNEGDGHDPALLAEALSRLY